ncbi:N-acetylneuraminate synthase family protein [bacterium]|nr:N-acetylneuraminate synthase family protein [bacterium]
MSQRFVLGSRTLQPGQPPYVVAEIGVNHNGDYDLAVRSIDAAVEAGVDAVKFQTFRAEEFMADPDHMYEYENQGEVVRESMYEMFKRLELPESWHGKLKAYSEEKGVDFLSSAADPLSANLLVRLGVPALKLASEDLINLPLLAHVGSLGQPVIVSTGMGDEHEVEQALETLKLGGCDDILLLHCVSLYPTPDEEVNLQRMIALRDRFGLPVGYSDHSWGIEASLAATALGALFIEKHFTLDRTLPGPDHALSSDPAEMKALVEGVRKVVRQLGATTIQPSPGEAAARRSFRRSIVAKTDLPVGTVLNSTHLHLKRPGTGLPPSRLERLLGKTLLRPLTQNEQLRDEDVG